MNRVEEYLQHRTRTGCEVVELAPGLYRALSINGDDRTKYTHLDLVTAENTLYLAFTMARHDPKPARTALEVYGNSWDDYAGSPDTVVEPAIDETYWRIGPGYARISHDILVRGASEAEALSNLAKELTVWARWYAEAAAVLAPLERQGAPVAGEG